jgi:hypothetical protein
VFCAQIDEVKLIAGILHTIVFHRALGLVRPKDIDLELFEITYVSDSTFFHVMLQFLLDENNLELHDDVCENLKLHVRTSDGRLHYL